MIILALGTNIEPREQYLKDALRKIEENNLKIKKLSSVYETPAWGGVDIIQKIELELGRIRKEHWGNRTIDIDIITYNNLVLNDDRLIVPHKYIHERNFVLAPLVEMYGDIEIDGKSIKQSLDKITEKISLYKEKL